MGDNLFSQILGFFLSLQIWGIVKGLLLFFLFLYIIFAIVVVRQVNLMKKALNGALDWSLILIAWLHLGFAIIVFLLALSIL